MSTSSLNYVNCINKCTGSLNYVNHINMATGSLNYVNHINMATGSLNYVNCMNISTGSLDYGNFISVSSIHLMVVVTALMYPLVFWIMVKHIMTVSCMLLPVKDVAILMAYLNWI